MNAKRYLQQIERFDVMIRHRLERLEYWRSMATKTTVASQTVEIKDAKRGTAEMHCVEKVQSTGSHDSMATAICEIVDLEANYAEEIKDISNQRAEIIKTLELLPAKEYELLYKMYVGIPINNAIEYLTIKGAAAEMDKSESWVKSTHGNALARIQKIIDEREQNAR